MKNLRERIEGLIRKYEQLEFPESNSKATFIDGSYVEDIATEIENLVKPLVRALENIESLPRMSPYERRISDYSMIANKALKELTDNEEDR